MIHCNKHHLKTTDTILQRGKRYKPEHYVNQMLAKKTISHIKSTPGGFIGSTSTERRQSKHFNKDNHLKTTDTVLQETSRPQIQKKRTYSRHKSPKRNTGTIKSLIQQQPTRITKTQRKRSTAKKNVSQPIFTPTPFENRNPNHGTRFNILGF